jgi:hypothetical protein
MELAQDYANWLASVLPESALAIRIWTLGATIENKQQWYVMKTTANKEKWQSIKISISRVIFGIQLQTIQIQNWNSYNNTTMFSMYGNYNM